MLPKAKLKARESGQTFRNNPVIKFHLLRGGIYTGHRIVLGTHHGNLKTGDTFDFFGHSLRCAMAPGYGRDGAFEIGLADIPESWFIDISGDCEIEQDAEVTA